MLPESDKEAVNLLGLSFLAVLFVSGLTFPMIWYFKESIVNILNSQQIEDYLWLVPPFIFVNGLFLALNNWNSRTKLFKRLKMMSYSGVKVFRVLRIVFSNFILFVPAGIILVALKIAEINQILIVIFSGVIIGIYYLYILKNDVQMKKILREFQV